MQVAPTMKFSRNVQGLELNELQNDDEKKKPVDAGTENISTPKRRADIDEPLMQDDQGSSLVSMIEYDTIEQVIAELRKLNPTGIHYYGSTGSTSRKLLEERVRSPYFIVNDSPLQQCNVFAPLGHARAERPDDAASLAFDAELALGGCG